MRNLAASIKQSIQLDTEKQLQLHSFKANKSLATLIPHRYSQTHLPYEHHQQQITKQQK